MLLLRLGDTVGVVGAVGNKKLLHIFADSEPVGAGIGGGLCEPPIPHPGYAGFLGRGSGAASGAGGSWSSLGSSDVSAGGNKPSSRISPPSEPVDYAGAQGGY